MANAHIKNANVFTLTHPHSTGNFIYVNINPVLQSYAVIMIVAISQITNLLTETLIHSDDEDTDENYEE